MLMNCAIIIFRFFERQSKTGSDYLLQHRRRAVRCHQSRQQEGDFRPDIARFGSGILGGRSIGWPSPPKQTRHAPRIGGFHDLTTKAAVVDRVAVFRVQFGLNWVRQPREGLGRCIPRGHRKNNHSRTSQPTKFQPTRRQRIREGCGSVAQGRGSPRFIMPVVEGSSVHSTERGLAGFPETLDDRVHGPGAVAGVISKACEAFPTQAEAHHSAMFAAARPAINRSSGSRGAVASGTMNTGSGY